MSTCDHGIFPFRKSIAMTSFSLAIFSHFYFGQLFPLVRDRCRYMTHAQTLCKWTGACRNRPRTSESQHAWYDLIRVRNSGCPVIQDNRKSSRTTKYESLEHFDCLFIPETILPLNTLTYSVTWHAHSAHGIRVASYQSQLESCLLSCASDCCQCLVVVTQYLNFRTKQNN